MDHTGTDHLTQGRAKEAAKYPDELCNKIIEGLREQMDRDISDVNEVINLIMDNTSDKGENFEGLWTLRKGAYWDDVHGVQLDEKLVLEARMKEMAYFSSMKVYVKTSMQECWDMTGKSPIMVRWVDTDKNCDPSNPNYRSRLVAMQFKVAGDRPALYSPTPPLEALKSMLALLAAARHSDEAWDEHKELGPVEVVHSDVSRAYFNAPTSEPTYVRIPDEDWEDGDEHRCARLLVSMYGTRSAASNWESHYCEWLESIGFERGVAFPSIFYNKNMNVKCLVHGDDFVTIGRRKQLEVFTKSMDAKYECKHVRMGAHNDKLKSMKVLNRIVRWEEKSISIEADVRHVIIAMKDLNLSDAK